MAKKPDPDAWYTSWTCGIIIRHHFEVTYRATKANLKFTMNRYSNSKFQISLSGPVYEEFLKMQKTGQFREKPETGRNLSGKKFASGIFFLCVDFNHTFIFSVSGTVKKI